MTTGNENNKLFEISDFNNEEKYLSEINAKIFKILSSSIENEDIQKIKLTKEEINKLYTSKLDLCNQVNYKLHNKINTLNNYLSVIKRNYVNLKNYEFNCTNNVNKHLEELLNKSKIKYIFIV